MVMVGSGDVLMGEAGMFVTWGKGTGGRIGLATPGTAGVGDNAPAAYFFQGLGLLSCTDWEGTDVVRLSKRPTSFARLNPLALYVACTGRCLNTRDGV